MGGGGGGRRSESHAVTRDIAHFTSGHWSTPCQVKIMTGPNETTLGFFKMKLAFTFWKSGFYLSFCLKAWLSINNFLGRILFFSHLSHAIASAERVTCLATFWPGTMTIIVKKTHQCHVPWGPGRCRGDNWSATVAGLSDQPDGTQTKQIIGTRMQWTCHDHEHKLNLDWDSKNNLPRWRKKLNKDMTPVAELLTALNSPLKNKYM